MQTAYRALLSRIVTLFACWWLVTVGLLAKPEDLAGARKLVNAGRYESAIASLRDMDMPQHTAEWHGMVSYCHEMLGHAAEAAAEASEALRLKPDEEQWAVQLGRVLLRFHAPGEAAKIYSDALARFPDSTALRLGRGLAFKDLQQVEEARRDLLFCLSRTPGLGLAFEALAEAEINAKEYRTVIEQAQEFRKHNAEEMRSYYYEAAARDKLMPDDPQVLTLVNDAIERAPSFAAAYALLGKALVDRNRFADALDPLQKAMRLRPGYSPTYLYLAKAYRGLGREDMARDATARWKLARDAENAPVTKLTYRH